MTISIWRYSHLALAVSSFLLLALASITGVILAFKPVIDRTQPYGTAGQNEITLARTLPVLRSKYPGISSLSLDANKFAVIKGSNADGENIHAYVNPSNGEILGTPQPENQFFLWVTALHRSLFIHELGRLFIGVTSFLLILIALSGTILIIQRQRGLKRFFTPIVRENFAQYFHVILGRWSLIPILIIAVSGTYLSLERFEFFKVSSEMPDINFDQIRSEPVLKAADFDIFKSTKLSEVESIEFPFSEDVEDYYTLKLKTREITVNQLTGEILSEINYPAAVFYTNLSLDLHTGRGSILWALILAVASANILFFIYSGFAMTFRRLANRTRNKFSAEEANYIILVGSENGNTFRFARAIYQELTDAGEKPFLCELNSYRVFPKAKQLIVMTATYGLGDAPSNSTRFMKLVDKYPQPQGLSFSVLGFGSHSYPDFCKFAFEVNNLLSAQEWATPLLEIHTIDDRSPEQFRQWAELWSQLSGVPVSLPETFNGVPELVHAFSVLEKSALSHEQGAFMIRLKPKRGARFTSGDLLAVYPANDYRERLYSIGKVEKSIRLSVKLYRDGLGSSYLYDLKPGDTIPARIVANPHFYFPIKASAVVMVSNGTGIAPFLGMIDQNTRKVPVHLYCGFRGESSVEIYRDVLDKSLAAQKLTHVHLAYSREQGKLYVKDLLLRDEEFIANILATNGVIMICGSLAMQQNVVELLEQICRKFNGKSVSYYQAREQVVMDCY